MRDLTETKPVSILLFHLSNELKDGSFLVSNKRPSFFWFNDSYFQHIWGDTPAYAYINFFIVMPHSNTKLFTRHGNGDFKSLWLDYEAYLVARKADPDKYNEPGIVLSFSTLIPLAIGKFEDGFNVTTRRTDNSQEANFSFGEPGSFTRFNEIPELVELIPELLSSVPILHPSKNVSEFWTQDKENAGRMWL